MSKRYFIDTEFMEDGKTIELISIGIISEDSRMFYAENSDADLSKANDFVKREVIPHLHGGTKRYPVMADGGYFPHAGIAEAVKDFIYDEPEFWGYYCDYDWVVLCQLFGRMVDLPEHFPKYCLDLKQLAFTLGNPRLPPKRSVEHHALADAIWTKEAWEYLEYYDTLTLGEDNDGE